MQGFNHAFPITPDDEGEHNADALYVAWPGNVSLIDATGAELTFWAHEGLLPLAVRTVKRTDTNERVQIVGLKRAGGEA